MCACACMSVCMHVYVLTIKYMWLSLLCVQTTEMANSDLDKYYKALDGFVLPLLLKCFMTADDVKIWLFSYYYFEYFARNFVSVTK